jgi:lysine decarboxylase
LDIMRQIHSARTLAAPEQAIGKLSAELVMPYPPGIPLLCPGEAITPQKIGALISMLESGMKVSGVAADPECRDAAPLIAVIGG